MSSFVDSLISRTTESVQSIKPRLRGKFEQDVSIPSFYEDILKLNHVFPLDSSVIVTPADKAAITEKTLVPLPQYNNASNSLTADTPQSSGSASTLMSQLLSRDHYGNIIQKGPGLELKKVPPENISENTLMKGSSMNEKEVYLNRHSKRFKEFRSANAGDDNNLIEHLQKTPVHPALSVSLIPIVKSANYFAKPDEVPIRKLFEQNRSLFMPSEPYAMKPTQTVNISIGRVEVRIAQPPVQVQSKPKNESVSVMSLDDFLNKRNQSSK